MADFKPADMPIIEPGNPVWQTLKAWAEYNLEGLRKQRETKTALQRELDIALGSITTLQALLALPDAIKQDRQREPVIADSFGIPVPKPMFDSDH